MLAHLLVSVLLALAPPPARREPLDEDEPSESEEELLMLSLSWPLPQEAAAQPPRSGRRLSVGELSEVVSGALLSMLAMPAPKQRRAHSHTLRGERQTHSCLFQWRHQFKGKCICYIDIRICTDIIYRLHPCIKTLYNSIRRWSHQTTLTVVTVGLLHAVSQ